MSDENSNGQARLFIWTHPASETTFVTFADTVDSAREAIVREQAQMMEIDDLREMVASPPTEEIEPSRGAVFVFGRRDVAEMA